MLCPSCRKHSNHPSECPHCGIIFEKWFARTALPATSAPAKTGKTVSPILLVALVAALTIYGYYFQKQRTDKALDEAITRMRQASLEEMARAMPY